MQSPLPNRKSERPFQWGHSVLNKLREHYEPLRPVVERFGGRLFSKISIDRHNRVEWIPVDLSSKARVVRVNGRTYVGNLFWQPLSTLLDFKKEVKGFLTQRHMNLYAVHRGAIPQAGYAAINQPDYKSVAGAFSLASSVAVAVGQPDNITTWLVVVKITNDEVALVACNAGQIIPGMDMIDSLDAVTALIKASKIFVWGRVFTNVPEVAALFPNIAVDRSIEDLLLDRPSKESRAYLEIDRRKEIGMVVGIGALVVVILGYSFYLYQDHKRAALAAALAEQTRQAIENRKQDAIAKARRAMKDIAVLPTWKEKPALNAWLNACQTTIDRMPPFIDAWAIEDAICKSTELVVRYKRPPQSTIADFTEQARKLVALHLAKSYLAEDAFATLRIDFTPETLKKRGDEELITSEAWRIPYASTIQSVGGKYEFAPKVLAATKPPAWVVDALGPDELRRFDPFWSTYTWRFTVTDLSAIEVLQAMGDMPGMVVDQITLAITGTNRDHWDWTAIGEMNVKKVAGK